MRPVRVLVPGTTGKFRCGGLLVELQTARQLSRLRAVEVVTYRQREPGRPFLADLLRQEPSPGKALWLVSWGFDVPRQLRLLRGRPVAYHAHSSGYGFAMPSGVPVLAVSRNTLGYWGQRASRNPLVLVPNALAPMWVERGRADGSGERPLDVLVQQRKCSAYVLDRLVPALRATGVRVELQAGWVDDLVHLFNSSKVVLYDSADHWRCSGVSEGFGLPPLEALACGCVVFSSLNHALADTLDPGYVGHQLGGGTLSADVERITAAVADPAAWRSRGPRLDALLSASSEAVQLVRWRAALELVDTHWDRLLAGEPPLVAPPLWALRARRWRERFRRLWARHGA